MREGTSIAARRALLPETVLVSGAGVGGGVGVGVVAGVVPPGLVAAPGTVIRWPIWMMLLALRRLAASSLVRLT